MAHFYGYFKGTSKTVTRTGTKNSGMEATLTSHQGAITVQIHHDKGKDMALVKLAQPDSGSLNSRVLYFGPLSGEEK